MVFEVHVCKSNSFEPNAQAKSFSLFLVLDLYDITE